MVMFEFAAGRFRYWAGQKCRAIGLVKDLSRSLAELDDAAAVALVGTGGGELLPLASSFAFGGDFEALLAAGVGFAIERLCDGRGATNVAEGENFDLKVAALVSDAQHVSDADVAGGLGGDLPVRLNAAEFAGTRGKGSRFEEARGPEPFVDAGHINIVQ
jgi:hypothetical protein